MLVPRSRLWLSADQSINEKYSGDISVAPGINSSKEKVFRGISPWTPGGMRIVPEKNQQRDLSINQGPERLRSEEFTPRAGPCPRINTC